ncbi:hypothetical protein VTK73DRAFT_9813 [Phialemonium thermophilum]|uniref:Zn(2)-C6 fungal-type domain-containing protein n=1 Tax=Phialemonium thermophilum TaxID=223376 RepID=A0ABR3XJR5_9PEZI
MVAEADQLAEDGTAQHSRPPLLSHRSTGAAATSITNTSNGVSADAMGSGASPEASGDESSPSSPGDDISPSGVKEESVGPSGLRNAAGEGLSMPVQKRRRVTRACDECRRKKIKCDGKQPCTHCSVYSYECTYDKPSNRRRNPAPQYIEALETRLQRAETLLRKFMPDVDLSDPNLDPAVQQEFRNREQARAQAARLKKENASGGTSASETQDAKILSMIETIGQLDLSERGEWDFHGTSSGAVFLRRMKEHFRGLLGHDYRSPFLPRPPRPPGMFSLDSPRSSPGSPWDLSALPNIYDLPQQGKARTLCYYSLNCATCLLRIVHAPSFYEMFDRVYELPPEKFGTEENRFLGLLYSVLALGCMYNPSQDDSSVPIDYKAAMDEGLKYYASARVLLRDVAECRDLTSLQGLIFMIFFLQVTSNISGCYSFVGIALRSAIRMGLHRHLQHAEINPIEDESRRRCFYVIRQMDTYISTVLGFPMLLSEEDVDQLLPTEVDDEYITKDGIISPPPGTPSFFQAFNANVKLMRILAKVVKYIYPLKGIDHCALKGNRPSATYLIDYTKIREIEKDLQDWYEELPIHWRPSPEGPIEVLRVRTLLRFGYAHVQMMLYRPFLHYASPRLSTGKEIDDRYYACAAAAISVSRNIVHIGTETTKQAVLFGPYWFILYTQFFAILSLVFYVLENPDKPGSGEVLADAKAGRDVIASLAKRSMAADRVTNTLTSLFEQLPERLKKVKGRTAPTRKRSAPVPRSSGSLSQARGGAQGVQPQRHSEELSRPQNGIPGDDQPRPIHRTSFDTVGVHHNIHSQNFSANLQDLLPLDVSTTAEGSEAGSTPGAMHPSFGQTHRPSSEADRSLYKFDDLMFSSGDPFAYPNQQPLMDLTSQAPMRQPPLSAGAPQQGSLQFYMPSLYDDIEGQLLGPVPPYMVGADQAQRGINLTPQMFGPTSMTPMQPRGSQAGNLPPQRHQRQLEDFLGDPNFRGDWGDVLGNAGYRQL